MTDDPHNSMASAFQYEFQRHRRLVEQALDDLSDEAFFRKPADAVNSIALIVKHMAGNLSSRWSNLLDTDGDKPVRDRDREFILEPADTREHLMADWESAWQTVAATLSGLRDEDLSRQITIRGEAHTVLQALARGATHTAYHAGQILYLARWLQPDAKWRTIPPGGSKQHGAGKYLRG